MDGKEEIVKAATELIEEKGEGMEEITVREICSRAGVGLGLINYYFGSKARLIEVCVERIVNGIVDRFCSIREETKELLPLERLEFLGNMTLSFLFEHSAVSKISVLTDARKPRVGDNTHRTYRAYLPLVAACRPDLSEKEIKRLTFCLVSSMQSAFMRSDVILKEEGIDLKIPEERKKYHSQIVRRIIGEKR